MENNFSQECRRRLGYHPVENDRQRKYYEMNRMKFMELYDYLALLYKPSRELSLALTELQNSLMWVNAHVACNHVGVGDE